MNRIHVTFVSLVLCLGFSPQLMSADQLNIHVLDAGEGQSVLLHANRHAVLIDTGHAGMAMSVLQRMKALGIQQLDYLVLTHLHPDHASGYFRVHEQYPSAVVLDNCYPVKAGVDGDMVRWVAQALDKNPERRCASQGDRIEWQGSEISILWPSGPLTKPSGLNYSSLVLQVSRGEQTLLVMGDAEKKAEAKMLGTQALSKVDILVVGHHGADDSCSEDFLRVVRPQVSVISINKDNFRGYPSPATLQRLDRYSGQVLKTYQSGEFHFVFD